MRAKKDTCNSQVLFCWPHCVRVRAHPRWRACAPVARPMLCSDGPRRVYARAAKRTNLLSSGKLYVFADGSLCYKGGLTSSTRLVLSASDLEDVSLEGGDGTGQPSVALTVSAVRYTFAFASPGSKSRRDSAHRSLMAVWSAQLAAARSRRQSAAAPGKVVGAAPEVPSLAEAAETVAAEQAGGADAADAADATSEEHPEPSTPPRTPETCNSPRQTPSRMHRRVPSNLSALTLDSMEDFRMSCATSQLGQSSHGRLEEDAGAAADANGDGGGEAVAVDGAAVGGSELGQAESSTATAPKEEEPSLYAQDDDIEGEEDLDPRVGEALEQLNEATDEVNRLENDLNGARRAYSKIKKETAAKVNHCVNTLEVHIRAAAPYYNALEVARQRKDKASEAALAYTDAAASHDTARAALRDVECALEGGATFDPRMQDEMGRCGEAVTRSAAARQQANVAYIAATGQCDEALAQLDAFSRRVKKHALLAKPYFDARMQAEVERAKGRKHCDGLSEQVDAAKARVADALAMLDRISREVHAKRTGQPLEEPAPTSPEDKCRESVMDQAEEVLERYKVLILPTIERRKSAFAAVREQEATEAAKASNNDEEDEALLPPVVSLEDMLGKRLSLVPEAEEENGAEANGGGASDPVLEAKMPTDTPSSAVSPRSAEAEARDGEDGRVAEPAATADPAEQTCTTVEPEAEELEDAGAAMEVAMDHAGCLAPTEAEAAADDEEEQRQGGSEGDDAAPVDA